MTVTIKDIAKAAGLSHSTVSRALRDHPAVAPATVQRVRAIAEELGYVPSAVARGLKTAETRVIGVIVSRITDPFLTEVLDGIRETLCEAGYSLFLAAGQDDASLDQAMQAMFERRPDGLIICSAAVEPDDIDRLRRQLRAPVVLAHNYADATTPDTLYHDDRFGGQAVTEHLLALGHTRIAYIGSVATGRVSREREAGFRAALDAAGLSPRQVDIRTVPENSLKSGYHAAAELLTHPDPPTALFCYNDVMAVGALRALREAGVRVPADCAVAGFDDIPLAAFTHPPLTTFAQPRAALGRQAADLVLQRREAPDPAPPVTLRGELVVRASTVPYR